MRFSLHALHDIAHSAGLKDPAAALVAAIALEESGGDPSGPAGDRGTSHGILQIHAPDWPGVAAMTRLARATPMVTEYGRAVAEVKLAEPVFRAASDDALRNARELDRRGFRPDLVDLLLLVDAAWQGPLGSWGARTTTGDPSEIREGTSPGRSARVRGHLAQLGIHGSGHYGWVLPVLITAGVGLVAWAALQGE